MSVPESGAKVQVEWVKICFDTISWRLNAEELAQDEELEMRGQTGEAARDTEGEALTDRQQGMLRFIPCACVRPRDWRRVAQALLQ